MSFWDRMEKVVNQGLESSREIIGKAKEKAKDLGEKGLLRYEITQIERQAEKKFSQLGATVYEKLVLQDLATVERGAVKELLDDIQELKNRLEELENDLKEVGK
jgi:polyhydroxyalkanoate synthesis regulator phasin